MSINNIIITVLLSYLFTLFILNFSFIKDSVVGSKMCACNMALIAGASDNISWLFS